MPKGKHVKIEVVMAKLHEAEVLLGKEHTVGQACRQMGISEHTYHCWGQARKGGFGRLDW